MPSHSLQLLLFTILVLHLPAHPTALVLYSASVVSVKVLYSVQLANAFESSVLVPTVTYLFPIYGRYIAAWFNS